VEKAYYTIIDSPIDPLLLVSDGESLRGVFMRDSNSGFTIRPEWVSDKTAEPFKRVTDQLEGYFRGELQKFDLPLAPSGTIFQLKVWTALQTISYANTLSYKQLAEIIGNLDAVRAVGAANGRNPISIIIPCHRVIGADGSLIGYGGGLDRKAALLAFERKVVAEGPQPFILEQLIARPKQASLF
jgi:methylated-DNA-[protein]-cysteine S-methyltransferase